MAAPPVVQHEAISQPIPVGAGGWRPCAFSGIEVREVSGGRDLGLFVDLPWRIYGGDPHWVPPLKLDVKEFLDPRRHPFYLHGAAAKFLALRQGRPVGRILVSDDPRYNELHGSRVGCFGMFECEDDRQAAAALLDAAAIWLCARGRTAMMGPIDYSMNYPCGLLVDGFDTPPRVMMNHHRPYYERLLESWGLAKIKDLHSWWFRGSSDLTERWGPRVERLAVRSGVTVRPFDRGDFEREVARCRDVYNEVGQGMWGFVGLTAAEFEYAAQRLNRMARPETVFLAEIGGRPVGFSITLPDVNEAIRPLNGRLTRLGVPVGLVRLLWRMRRVKTARVLVLHVREGFRRRGIGELLILRTLDCGRDRLGYTGAELGWTDEDNEPIVRTIESVGAKPYKTYRIYERPIG